MSHEVLAQRCCHVLALWHDAHAGWGVLDNFVHEQRVVCAAENERVDVGVEAHDAFDALFDKVVGAWRVVLKVFDEWHPHGACERRDGDVGA